MTQLTTADTRVRDKRITVMVRHELVIERANDDLVGILQVSLSTPAPRGVGTPPTRLEATDAIQTLVAGSRDSRGSRDHGTSPGIRGGREGEVTK